MKKQILLGLVLASWWTSLLPGQSPPPPPTPTATSDQKQEIGRDKNSPPEKEDSPTPTLEASPTQSNPEPTAQASETPSTKNSKESSFDYNALAVTIFTAALAYLAWLQWRAMRKQGDYMRQQSDYMKRNLPVSIKAARSARFSAIAAQNAVKIARKNTAIIERAVVLLESVVAEPHGASNEHYLLPNSILVITLKNYGATVAYKVIMEGKIVFEDKTMMLHGAPGATMAPQSSHKWITYSLVATIPHEDIERAVTGNNLLSYVIDVTYEDVFGKAHKYRDVGSYISTLRGFISGGSTSD